MSETALFGITKLLTSAVSAVMTGPIGGMDIPAGDFNATIAHRAPGYQATVSWPDGGIESIYRARGAIPVDMGQLPEHFLQAVMAAEDRRFLQHHGVDPVGTLSAGLDVLSGQFRGGSSITQQMVKNTALGAERTIDRKIIEAIIATRAHDELGAERVMQIYLENAWFGRGQVGVMLAPQAWFGKSWGSVTIAESALLAAMLKGPAWYDPVRFPERTRDRRNYVIEGMFSEGWISQAERDAALAEAFTIAPYLPTQTALGWAASLADYVIGRDELMRPTPKDLSNVEITTTLDLKWQSIAETELKRALRAMGGFTRVGSISAAQLADLTSTDASARRNGLLAAIANAPVGAGGERIVLTELGETPRGRRITVGGQIEDVRVNPAMPGYTPALGDILVADVLKDEIWSVTGVPGVQGAIIIMDPRNGNVITSVGGFDARVSTFDRTRALRQPGSAIKPFLFLAALDNGLPADHWVNNTRKTYRDANGTSWSPRNYDRSETGGMPMYRGLERSSNLVAADLINQVGPEEMARVAEAAGVYPQGGMRRLLSSSLGVTETRLLDLVAGYASILNDGAPRRPQGIAEIEAGERIELPSSRGTGGLIAGRGPIEDIISMMRGTIIRGTASEAFRAHPVTLVGKTGTTQEYRDAWFVGVTPHLAIGVWVGRDNNRPLPGNAAGGRTAAPVAAAILKKAFDEGLVNKYGLRDQIMTSGLYWPPAVIGGTAELMELDYEEDNFTIETNEYFYDSPSYDAGAPLAEPDYSRYGAPAASDLTDYGNVTIEAGDNYFGDQAGGQGLAPTSGGGYFDQPGSGGVW